MRPILSSALARTLGPAFGPILVWALALVLAVSPAAYASPNADPEPAKTTSASGGASPSVVTDQLKCIVTSLEDDRVLKVWDEETRTERRVRIDDKVDIKPRRKKDFDGRDELELADLEPGHRLKITYRLADGKILDVKVLEKVAKLPTESNG
jgi:hypothetical protein